jgi:hypothetical protein
MPKRWTTLAVGVAAVMVPVAPVTVSASAATTTARSSVSVPAPASVSLSGWDLVLPIDSSGGTSGDAETLSPARLYSPYLTQNSSGALHFWAPSDGARLGISAHARTELRGTGTFTLGQGSAGLTETATVTQVPDQSQDIIIGQMFPSGTSPFAMIHYQTGKVYAYINGQSQEYVLMTGIPVGGTFSDSITANGGTVTFSVTYRGKTATKTATGISSWIGDTMHFQAGDYQQDLPGSPASDGGRVTFSALSQYGVSSGGGGSFPGGYHQMVVQNSHLCVDVNNDSTANNAVIDQWACKSSGQANQEFQFLPVSGGYGELQNQNSGKDIVVQGASTTQGADIIQYTQNGTTNGLWLPVQQSDGTWQFRNENSGLCLDQTGDVSTQGIQFDQWTCKSGTASNQDFATQ